nr:antirestriction protein ArdA [Nesterenkonia sp. AY15]
MSATTTTPSGPRAWVGCLACYNEGTLMGDWFPAVEAVEVTSGDVHDAVIVSQTHEELWVFDHEGLPLTGELDPTEASAWAHRLLEAPKHERDALGAWVRSGDCITEGDSKLPVISEFAERYCGEWPSFFDFAQNLAEEIGLLSEVPENVTCYFDWNAWTRDLGLDYTTEAGPEGGVFVFRSF